MAKSTVQFDRWKPRDRSTWAFQVFKKHNIELLRMFTTFDNVNKYTYKKLGESGAQWDDLPTKHFVFSSPKEFGQFSDLKNWSTAFNQLENWVNLNALMAITSNIETYMATVVPLALESDIGVLFGASRRIDGIEIVKYGRSQPFNFEEKVVSCTKGAWDSRSRAYERTFGRIPKIISTNISTLEKLRNARNKIGHAFGRDIELSRDHASLTVLPTTTIRRDALLKYQRLLWIIAKAIDVHLLTCHIGEYQALLFYHKIYPSLRQDIHIGMRSIEFKKQIGRFGAIPPGKEFCKGLVTYYEGL